MRKLALAVAAAAAMAFTAPAFAASEAPAASGRIQLAQADVKVKRSTTVRHGNVVRKKVVVRHGDNVRRKVVIRDRGLHRGWRHSRHYGARKTVVIKRQGPHRTVVKKKIVVR
jgi:acyl-coenzyme A synthetase/AMP-(fatty) acid ligase